MCVVGCIVCVGGHVLLCALPDYLTSLGLSNESERHGRGMVVPAAQDLLRRPPRAPFMTYKATMSPSIQTHMYSTPACAQIVSQSTPDVLLLRQPWFCKCPTLKKPRCGLPSLCCLTGAWVLHVCTFCPQQNCLAGYSEKGSASTHRRGELAQMVEHPLSVRKAIGSIPIFSTVQLQVPSGLEFFFFQWSMG